jgi:FkbM family methyltransferase
MAETAISQAETPDFTYTGDAGTDRFLREKLFPDWSYRGVFLEVGAADPVALSVSNHFRRNGWRVIAVEPNPIFCERFRRRGLPVLEYAASNVNKDDVDFEIYESLHGTPAPNPTHVGVGMAFSSLGLRQPRGDNYPKKVIKVKVRRLDTILARHCPNLKKIDLVCVDVEGWEMEVMGGFDLGRWKPRAVVLENFYDGLVTYRTKMADRGYRLLDRVGGNDVFVPF